MKKLIIVAIAFSSLGVYSCKKLDKLTRFYLDYNSTFTVPANSGLNLPLDLFTPDITTNYEDQFSANDTRKDLVDEIKIDNINITVKSPQGSNLDFLKSIHVFISADGLAEKEVAWKDNIADGLTSLDLEHTGDNLKDYIMKDKIKLRIKSVTDKATNQDITLDVKNRFLVNAKILGA